MAMIEVMKTGSCEDKKRDRGEIWFKNVWQV